LAVACALVLAAAWGTTACGEDAKGYDGCHGRDANYDASYPDFPAEDAQDWVSYGDHAAVFHLRKGSEREQKGTRTGELVIDRLLFSRAGAKKAPHTFRTDLWQVPCKPWIKEGHSYTGLLVFDAALRGAKPAWHPVYGDGVLPYDDKKIGTGEIEGKDGTLPLDDTSPFWLARQFHGEHAMTLQSLLLKAEPYQAAARHPELTPGERAELVQKDREKREASSAIG
jgi:hypothetical protein